MSELAAALSFAFGLVIGVGIATIIVLADTYPKKSLVELGHAEYLLNEDHERVLAAARM